MNSKFNSPRRRSGLPARRASKRFSRSAKKNETKQMLTSVLSGSKPFQKQVQILVPGQLRRIVSGSLLSTTTSIPLNPQADVVDWDSYSNVYDEYRVLSVTVFISPMTITSGLSTFFMDEDNSAPPTAAEAAAKASNVYSNSTVSAPVVSWKGYQYHGYHMQFTPATLVDLDWYNLSTPYERVWLKSFTDNGFYATPDSTPLFVIRAIYTLSFRGVQ